jgi:prevent-host-death family protein
MTTFDLGVAKAQLARLIDRAQAGEEIILAKGGEPVARIVPYVQERAPRRPGALRGKIRLGPDFFAPLPRDVLAAFGAIAPRKRKPRTR